MYQRQGLCLCQTLSSKPVVRHRFMAVYPGIRSHSRIVPSLSPLVNPMPSLIWNTWLRSASTSNNRMNDRLKPVEKNERNKTKKKMRSLDKAMDLFLSRSLKNLPPSGVKNRKTQEISQSLTNTQQLYQNIPRILLMPSRPGTLPAPRTRLPRYHTHIFSSSPTTVTTRNEEF